jgi:Zn finger protein HypA/HybF involved in hydrogenase expression
MSKPYSEGWCRQLLPAPLSEALVSTIALTVRPTICYPAYKYHFRRKAMQAYCVKCRAKKEMKNPKATTMKNGKPATQGVCPTCGTKMFRIGKA